MDNISLNNALSNEIVLGLDPGRDKCGVAVMNGKDIIAHRVVDAEEAIAIIEQLIKQYAVNLIVMGNGTTSKTWQEQIESRLPNTSVVSVNEANSTLEARDRYWLMYPPKGIKRLIPQGLMTPPRPVDDIVAILLIERYLASKAS